MYIGLYDKPTNACRPGYRGLFRSNGLIDFYYHESPLVRDRLAWFFKNSSEGMHIEYSEENQLKLQALHNILCSVGWYGDMLFFTDTKAQPPLECAFLGYDVCADSKYYSPLGDGFLDSYSHDCVFYAKMDFDEYSEYAISLNQNGLFSSYLTAELFAKYCNLINKEYEHAVETEGKWRPFAIYRIW